MPGGDNQSLTVETNGKGKIKREQKRSSNKLTQRRNTLNHLNGQRRTDGTNHMKRK